jgi:acetyl-CoA carboxylase biotin carboxylase subunit
MTKSIRKVLIANRGEIAVRVMRTCREMGVRTVAVFSEADRKALHVRLADEAYCIGPAPSIESYLRADTIIETAKACGADAIHPGYGFLSEKEHFSRACRDAGVIFIGPGPEAIAAMGDKITARNIAKKAGVPTVPGTLEPVSDLEKIKAIAADFGYPVLLKATAGGGGKGMRAVNDEKDLKSAFDMAASEAKKAFNDDRLYVEKLILEPRHVEIQIACDAHGNGIFLMERECSMQRRHQKVIEEAPCSYLKDEVRRDMAKAALSLAKEAGYLGVGTVECLVDADQNFYFLEMNTRLQVEHTVTEMVTGIDLVRLQIQIANGEKIPFGQKDVAARGHAIECRVYAEDPANGFMPSPGRVYSFRPPEGPGIRHDTGIYAGAEIPIHYDPMISKLIVHAGTRAEAIEKMRRALSEFEIGGPRNNLAFLRALIADEAFRKGEGHTQYIDRHPELARPKDVEWPIAAILAAAAWDSIETERAPGTKAAPAAVESNWRRHGLAETMDRRM